MRQSEKIQRQITKAALSFLSGTEFALAGSGAIREHGIINRPTEDIDLFTTSDDSISFGSSVDSVCKGLAASGYTVTIQQRAEHFARLIVAANGLSINIDLGVDWREDHPIIMDVGPVLNIVDAVGNKMSALYSRSEARDFLDVDRIRLSGFFSDEELLHMLQNRDPGFDKGLFLQQLDCIKRLEPYQVSIYGVSAARFQDIKMRFAEWRVAIASS